MAKGIKASAQKPTLSTMAGIRQGASLWLAKSGKGTAGEFSYPSGQRFICDKELFARFQVHPDWFSEVALQHYSLGNRTLDATGHEQNSKSNFLQLNLTAQYDVSYPMLGYLVPYFFKMRSYVGVSLSPRIAFVNGTEAGGATYHSSETSVLAGVSYSHMLPITSRLWCYSTFSYRALVVNRFSSDRSDIGEANRALSCLGGICYSLK
jgi:hypothetical protein